MKLLVIDIGGMFIKYAVMDQEMKIVTRGRVATPENDAAALVDVLEKLYLENGNVSGITICLPRIIDSDQGHVIMGGALRYNDGFNLRDAIYERTRTAIYMENDAKCAACFY